MPGGGGGADPRPPLVAGGAPAGGPDTAVLPGGHSGRTEGNRSPSLEGKAVGQKCHPGAQPKPSGQPCKVASMRTISWPWSDLGVPVTPGTWDPVPRVHWNAAPTAPPQARSGLVAMTGTMRPGHSGDTRGAHATRHAGRLRPAVWGPRFRGSPALACAHSSGGSPCPGVQSGRMLGAGVEPRGPQSGSGAELAQERPGWAALGGRGLRNLPEKASPG